MTPEELSTPAQTQSQSQPAQSLLILVTLIGLGALTAGTISLLFPTASLQIYGIRLSSSSLSPPSRSSTPRSAPEPIMRSLSIRNLTLGLAILSLTSYWQSLAEVDAQAAKVVQACLGYVISCGSIVPAVDAYGAWRDGVGKTGRMAVYLHCGRLCAWVVGGVWCFWV